MPHRAALDRFILRLSYTITAAWIVSFLVDLFDRSYDPPPTVHALMLAVAGSFLGGAALRNRPEHHNDHDDEVRKP